MKDTRSLTAAAVLCSLLAFGVATALKTPPPKTAPPLVAPPVPPKAPPVPLKPVSPVPLKPASPVPLKAPACDISKCNGLVAKYYKEINCKPVFEKDTCCPSRFDCPAAAIAEDRCHLGGAVFSPGAAVPDALSGPCTSDCICKEFAGKVNIHCLTAECEEPPPGCVPLFKQNACCAYSFHCKNASKTDPSRPKKEATCSFDGRSYLEGEQLLTPGDPCKICTCQKGFNGSLGGAWCRERSCDLQLTAAATLRRGCAPVFYGDKECCPSSWRCPSAADKVIPAKTTPTPVAPGKPKEFGGCVFGGLHLGAGDALSPTAEDEVCSCSFPPHVTCARREVAFDLDLIDLQ